jgi:hypothetical protein
VSTDGGANWTPTGLNGDILTLGVDPANPNVLFGSTPGPNQSIIRSTDGGRSWVRVNTTVPPVSEIVVSPTDSSSIYAAIFAAGVYESSNGGFDWAQAGTGLRGLDLQVLAVDLVEPTTVYAGGKDGLYRTSDAGAGWSLVKAVQLTLADVPAPPGLPFPPVSAIPPFQKIAPAGVKSLLRHCDRHPSQRPAGGSGHLEHVVPCDFRLRSVP